MSLPRRGTGLRTGRARPRGYPPLTEEQRRVRHARITRASTDDTALWLGIGSLLLGATLIGVVILT